MTPELRGRIFRELLQIQLCRVSFLEALEAVAEELQLDLLRAVHEDVRRGGGVADGLARLAPEAREALAAAEREGRLLDVLGDLADWSPGRVPPEGTLARDLYAVYAELARLWGEGLPMVPALERASALPVRAELRDALRGMAKAESCVEVMKDRPALFAPSVVAMVRQTEYAGNMHQTFLILADGVMSGAYLPRGGDGA